MLRESSFCYICLDNDRHLMNIARADSNKVKFLDMLTYLSFETSCIEDDIPMYICDDCQKHLRTAYDLKVKCQKNNIHVRRYIFYLKQFTHPTTFTNEPIAVQKENTTNKSDTDEFITIKMDLTDVGDESDVETSESAGKNQQNTELESEISATSILSKRPEFNTTRKHSKLLNINNKPKICFVKIMKPSDRKLNKSANTVSTITRILSNRPEFNIYKNISQTKIMDKETSSLTEETASVIGESNSAPVNNVTSSINKVLKKSTKPKLKSVLQKTENTNTKNRNSETRPEFVEFDISSTVKLRKRGVTITKPVNDYSFKQNKVQKMTYNVKKDKKAIQRMNKCKVVLSRCQIVKNKPRNSETKTTIDEPNLIINNTNKDTDLTNSNSIEIKQETNNLDYEHCTDKNNTFINIPSEKRDVAFENILIKQEINDTDTNITDVDQITKPALENDEFSIKIEIIDDNSSNSVTDRIKLEKTAENSENRDTVVTSTENGINSVFSFMNAEFLTPYGQSTSSNVDLPGGVTNTNVTGAMIEPGNSKATVGTANKALDLSSVTTCDTTESDISGELIIDEVASSTKKLATKTASPSKIMPGCGKRNIFKRFLNFTSNEPDLPAEKITRTVGTLAPAIGELVHLPHYKFPVSKRVLNFSSKEQTVDNASQIEHKSFPTNIPTLSTASKITVGQPASHLRLAQLHSEHRKVLKTIGSPATKVKSLKSATVSRKLPTKVGNPVIIGTNLSENVESPIDFMTKQMKLMNKYMNPPTDIGIDEIAKQTNNFGLISSVGRPGEDTASVPTQSNLPIINDTRNITSMNLVHLEYWKTGDLGKCFMAKQMKLMNKYMNPLMDVGIDGITKQTNNCGSSSSVGNAVEETTSIPTESNLPVINDTSNITSVNLVQLEDCKTEVLDKCLEKSHDLVSQAKISIGKSTVEAEDIHTIDVRVSKDCSLKCPTCNKQYRSKLKLKKHALIHKNFYHCPICTDNFPTKTKFKVHMLIHNESKYKCFICNTRTLTNKSLVQHYKIEHDGTKICIKCKTVFTTDNDYINHMKRHESKRTCTVCNKSVAQKTFSSHMKSHERSKCSLCDKYFDMKQLNEHNCTEQWERTYKCTECDRTFYFQPSLEKHMMVHYEMQCFICKVTFAKPHAIVEHMSRHIGPNGYQCPICSMSTFSKDSMKLHMTEHYGEINNIPAQIITKYV